MRVRTPAPRLLCLLLLAGCGAEGASGSAGSEPGTAAGDAPEAADLSAAGTIRGSLGGEERSWNVLTGEDADGPQSTAVYRTRDVFGNTAHMLTLGAHAGSRPTTRDMISLGINTTESLDDCPCTLEGQTVEYFVSFSEVYRARDAEIVVERFEPAEDGWYRASGRFSGTLTPAEESEGARGGEPREITGSFDIARVLRRDSAR